MLAHRGRTQRVLFPSFSACQGFCPLRQGWSSPPTTKPTRAICTQAHQGRTPRVRFPSPRVVTQAHQGRSIFKPIKGAHTQAQQGRLHQDPQGSTACKPTKEVHRGSASPLFLPAKATDLLSGVVQSPHNQAHKGVHRGSPSPRLLCPSGLRLLFSGAVQSPRQFIFQGPTRAGITQPRQGRSLRVRFPSFPAR